MSLLYPFSVEDVKEVCREIRRLKDDNYLPEGMTEKQTEVFNRSRVHYIRDCYNALNSWANKHSSAGIDPNVYARKT